MGDSYRGALWKMVVIMAWKKPFKRNTFFAPPENIYLASQEGGGRGSGGPLNPYPPIPMVKSKSENPGPYTLYPPPLFKHVLKNFGPSFLLGFLVALQREKNS